MRLQVEDDPDHCHQLASQTRKLLAEELIATDQEAPRAVVRAVRSPIVDVKVAADPVLAEKVVEADVRIAASEVSVLRVVAVLRRPKRSWTPRWRITLAERNRATLQLLPMALLEVRSSLLVTIST